MNPGMFLLSSEDFPNQLTYKFRDFVKEGIFADVTLVSGYQKQVQAHRLILSACSPVLKSIFLNNTQTNAMLYLRGVTDQMLHSMLQYMYFGEATIYQDHLKDFLELAKDLQMAEICQKDVSKGESDSVLIKSDNADGSLNGSETVKMSGSKNQHSKHSACNQASQTEDPIYSCDQCDKQYTSLGGLVRHQRSIHEGLVYSCDQCEYQANERGNMRKHQKYKHEGVRYSCNLCEYQATTRGSLKIHQQSIHEGIRFFCDSCEFQASTKASLVKHFKSQHDGLSYFCDPCDEQFAEMNSLKKHQESNHDCSNML